MVPRIPIYTILLSVIYYFWANRIFVRKESRCFTIICSSYGIGTENEVGSNFRKSGLPVRIENLKKKHYSKHFIEKLQIGYRLCEKLLFWKKAAINCFLGKSRLKKEGQKHSKQSKKKERDDCILSMVKISTESRGFQLDNVRGIAVP